MMTMTNKHPKTKDIRSISGISITPMAQWKMALHATSKPHVNVLSGGGQPCIHDGVVHGIVLGHRVKSTAGAAAAAMVVTDVVPVCRETPTKPLVDMALRLVEAHLMVKEGEETKIIGWYTCSSSSSSRRNGGGEEEEEEDASLPNASACRILSSMAESTSCDGVEQQDFVLLSLSKSKLDNFIMNYKNSHRNGENDNVKSSMKLLCKAYQWETKSQTLARRNDLAIIAATNDNDDETKGQEQLTKFPTVVYDFVDHMNDCDFVDSKWIENIHY